MFRDRDCAQIDRIVRNRFETVPDDGVAVGIALVEPEPLLENADGRAVDRLLGHGGVRFDGRPALSRISIVGTGRRVEPQRTCRDVRADQPEVIHGGCHTDRPGIRDEAVGGFQPDHATPARRNPNRATLIGSDREVDVTCCDGCP